MCCVVLVRFVSVRVPVPVSVSVHVLMLTPVVLSQSLLCFLFTSFCSLLHIFSYSAPLYVDMTKTTITTGPNGGEEQEQEQLPKVFIGKVPIMLRSTYCMLSESTDKDLAELGECPFDQVRVLLPSSSASSLLSFSFSSFFLFLLFYHLSLFFFSFILSLHP